MRHHVERERRRVLHEDEREQEAQTDEEHEGTIAIRREEPRPAGRGRIPVGPRRAGRPRLGNAESDQQREQQRRGAVAHEQPSERDAGEHAAQGEADGETQVDDPVDQAVGADARGRRHEEDGGRDHFEAVREPDRDHARTAERERRDHRGPPAYSVGEESPERPRDGRPGAIERCDQARLRHRQVTRLGEVDREEGEHEAAAAIDEGAGPQEPERARQAPGEGAEGRGESRRERHGGRMYTVA